MSVYADNRFDVSRQTQYCHRAEIGPLGRRCYFNVNTKALTGYPGWHSVHMHADRAHSVDCTTRDVIGCIAELQAEWEAELKESYGHD